MKSNREGYVIKKGTRFTVTRTELTQTCLANKGFSDKPSSLNGKHPIYRIKLYVSDPKVEYIKYESGVNDKVRGECLWHSAIAAYMMNTKKSGYYFAIFP